MYYCNYLAPVKFTVPSSLSASRDTQSLLPGLGSLMSDGLNLGDGVSLTTGDTASQDGLEMPPVTIPGTPADLSGKFADKFSSKTVATAYSYQSKDLAVTVTQHSYGTGNDKVSYYKRRGEKTQPRGPQRKIVDAYVRQLAQRAVWDLKSRTLQKGTQFRNLTLGDAPVGKREKKQKTGPPAWEKPGGKPRFGP